MLLDFQKTKELLEKYGINAGVSDIFADADKAAEFAKNAGYPIALKAFSKELLHRSDIGGVSLDIKDEQTLKSEFSRLKNISETIIAQKMAFGQSVIIGMKRDAQFGPVVLFGAGGIFIEIIKDVSLRLCPITQKEALEMIKEIKTYPILSGARGQKPVNINELAKIIASVCQLAAENEYIKEIDLNPVIVDENNACAVDFKFLV